MYEQLVVPVLRLDTPSRPHAAVACARLVLRPDQLVIGEDRVLRVEGSQDALEWILHGVVDVERVGEVELDEREEGG